MCHMTDWIVSHDVLIGACDVQMGIFTSRSFTVLMWPLVHGQRLQPVVLFVLFHRVTPTHAWQHGNVLCMTYTVKVDIEVNGITRILLYIIPSIDHHLQETIPGIQYCVKTACIKLFTTHYIHVCACTAAL